MKIRLFLASSAAYLFIIVILLISSGLLPRLLEVADYDSIELSEDFEDDAEEEKQENKNSPENDQFHYALQQEVTLNHEAIKSPDGLFHKWQNPSSDIITPPPEFI